MQSKIYAIYWWDLDVTYIGQTSQTMARRISEHTSKLAKETHYNKKLQDCYNLSKNFSFIVLDRCEQKHLDILEIQWISEFNSTNRIYGANKTSGGYSAGKGVFHAKSKYSKMLILKTFSMILKGISVKDILARLPIDRSLIYGIKDGRAHTWLGDEYPEKYGEMLNTVLKRSDYTGTNVYPNFVDKHGTEYSDIRNLTEFCKNNPDLKNNYITSASGLRKMLAGIKPSYKGFRLV